MTTINFVINIFFALSVKMLRILVMEYNRQFVFQI